jgi:hypothetical protein
LFGDKGDRKQEKKRPDDAMSNDLKRGYVVKKFPVDGKEAPKHVCADSVQNSFFHLFSRVVDW